MLLIEEPSAQAKIICTQPTAKAGLVHSRTEERQPLAVDPVTLFPEQTFLNFVKHSRREEPKPEKNTPALERSEEAAPDFNELASILDFSFHSRPTEEGSEPYVVSVVAAMQQPSATEGGGPNLSKRRLSDFVSDIIKKELPPLVTAAPPRAEASAASPPDKRLALVCNGGQTISASPLTKTFCETSVFDESLFDSDKKQTAEARTSPMRATPPALLDEKPAKRVNAEALLPSDSPQSPSMMLETSQPLSQENSSVPMKQSYVEPVVTQQRPEFAHRVAKVASETIDSRRLWSEAQAQLRRVHAELEAVGGRPGPGCALEAFIEENERKYKVDPSAPSIGYLLSLKIFRCVLVSSQIAAGKNARNKLQETETRLRQLRQTLCRGSASSSVRLSTKEKLLQRVFNLRTVSVLHAPQSDELLYTFLFREELIIITRTTRTEKTVDYLQLFLAEQGPTATTLRSAQERAHLTDALLANFKAAGGSSPALHAALRSICGSFAVYADVLAVLRRLHIVGVVKAFYLERGGELNVHLQPRTFPYLELLLTARPGPLRWDFNVQINQTDKSLKNLVKEGIDPYLKETRELMSEAFNAPPLHVPERLERTVRLCGFLLSRKGQGKAIKGSLPGF